MKAAHIVTGVFIDSQTDTTPGYLQKRNAEIKINIKATVITLGSQILHVQAKCNSKLRYIVTAISYLLLKCSPRRIKSSISSIWLYF